ncbi:leukotriene C4 synthase-like isoform X1 [Struthio camelus]|uniref:leukotriene C4 synthase-like isoform X1 n=1 Tax=Struthio camelus TaxID=8801 RepID=UPI003604277E
MRNQIDLLAAVTVLGVLEQAYFALQVIYARRKYKISPPETRGHPEFERIFRAQVNCSEYFPIFISLLWVAGIFFHQGAAAASGLLYLCARFQYFHGYAQAPSRRSETEASHRDARIRTEAASASPAAIRALPAMSPHHLNSIWEKNNLSEFGREDGAGGTGEGAGDSEK